MTPSAPRFWLDVVDPLSFVMEDELRALEAEGLDPVARGFLELRPPPAELVDPEGRAWGARWEAAAEVAARRGVALAEQDFVPWSRKAHELLLHAREVEREAEVRAVLLRAFHVEGRDLGRVDVLVALAAELGLDRTRTKAVLDVDRHAAAAVESAVEARALGASAPPALWTGSRLVEGFHDRDALRTLLIPPGG